MSQEIKLKENRSISSFALWQKFSAYNKNVSWVLFVFICIFTMGSWIDISGVWCELPLIVSTQPESWRLPSILGAITQIAQIGPLIYIIGRFYFPRKFSYIRINFAILAVGALSCLILAFVWKRTVVILNEERSIFLYILNFSLALLDGTSTLTFLPYIIQNWNREYIIANYIGESLSSLVPGLLSLAQGYHSEEECFNLSFPLNFSIPLNNNTNFKTEHSLNFSVSVYFLLMFTLLSLSLVALGLIHFLRFSKNHRRIKPTTSESQVSEKKSQSYDIKNSASSLNLYARDEVQTEQKDPTQTGNKKILALCYFFNFFVSFIYYGIFPGIQSFSTLPYSTAAYRYSVNLSCIFLPFSVFASIWSYNVSSKRIVYEAIVPSLISVYILITGIFSPCPPLVTHFLGEYLIVVCWVVASCWFMRIRCLVSSKLEKYGEKILFISGCFTLMGQIVGGITIYICIDIFRLLKEKDKCSPVDFCYL